MHDYLTQPTVSESDRIVHSLKFLACAVKDAPVAVYHDQLTSISNLCDLFRGWNPQQPAPLPNLATPLLSAGAPPPHPQHPVALPTPPPLRSPPRVATPTVTPPPPPDPSLDTPLPPLSPGVPLQPAQSATSCSSRSSPTLQSCTPRTRRRRCADLQGCTLPPLRQ